MIIGSIRVENDAVVTHRESYRLFHLSVVSVRRPFLVPAFLVSASLGAFGFAFHDLLFDSEKLFIAGAIVASIVVGWSVAQLKLLSRDLRGSELSDAIWGSAGCLQRVRSEIIVKLSKANRGLGE